MKNNIFKEKIKGKKLLFLGIGVSNIPFNQFLLKFNVSITAFDKRKRPIG